MINLFDIKYVIQANPKPGNAKMNIATIRSSVGCDIILGPSIGRDSAW